MHRLGAFAFTIGLTATLAATAVPNVALAGDDLGFAGCNAKPTKTDTAEAKRSYERGKRLFDERDRGAIDLFRAAYVADCTKHELLVVLSFAYQSDGQLKEALVASELYLKKRGGSLSAEDRHTVEERIALLTQKRKEQDADAAAAAATAPKAIVVAPPAMPPPRAEAPVHHSPLPWVLVGIGAAAVVTGAILFPVGSALVPDSCEGLGLFSPNSRSTCTANPGVDATSDTEKAGRGKGLRLGGFLSMAAGGAAVAGGLVWAAVDAASSSSSTTGRRRIVPILSPTELGIAGTF